MSYRELREKDIQQVQEVALIAWAFTYLGICLPSTIRLTVPNTTRRII